MSLVNPVAVSILKYSLQLKSGLDQDHTYVLQRDSTFLLPYKLTICLLVTKVSVKSFTNERPLEYVSAKCPFFVT